MRIWIFVLSLFAIVVLASVLISPKDYRGKKASKKPQLEFFDYQAYEILPSGVVSVLVSTEGRHYENRDELDEPFVVTQRDDVFEVIYGRFGTIKDDVLTLKEDVRYYTTNEESLTSSVAVYNSKKNILKGSGGFVATTKDGTMAGSEFVLDNNKKQLDAKRIKATLILKD